jgi:type II secretory pathway component PulK
MRLGQSNIGDAEAGFALPAVLTTLTILTMIYLTVMVAGDSFFKETLQQKRELAFQLDAMSAEAELAYWATTQPPNRNALAIGAARNGGVTTLPIIRGSAEAGLQFLKIDGTDYAWRSPRGGDESALAVAIQDDAGLINLDFATIETKARIFELAGLEPNDAQTLAAQAEDLMDSDDFISLKGAEYEDYRRANRPPPLNRPLGNLFELYGLLDWDRLRPPRWTEVSTLLTAQYDSAAFNINTAPPQALSLALGLNPAQAQAAIERRRINPIYSISELGLVDDNERLYTYPNGRFHFTAIDHRFGLKYSSRLTLTPDDADRPIWTDLESVQRITLRGNPKLDQLPAFPKPSLAIDASGGN